IRQFLRHNSILVSKVRSLQQTQGASQAVVAIGMTAALVVAMWVFGDQLIAILNHLPATSFRGKFWKVAGVVVVAAVAQSWVLWRVWAQLLSGGTGSRADVIPIAVGAAIPIVLGSWVVLATIPVVFGFTAFALIVAVVVIVILMWANN
ncbi:hypothetical protein, partial [Kocuria sp. ICS0012]|uniref:hypothetical protein n=1 Tax=Kocuria sp. ICS0012 TaxID=1834155 RepID=UPI000B18534C